MELTARERDTCLVALIYWRDHLENKQSDWAMLARMGADSGTPLTASEIDSLIDVVNEADTREPDE